MVNNELTDKQKAALEKFLKRVRNIQWNKSLSHSILSSSIALFREFWRRHKILVETVDLSILDKTPYMEIYEGVRIELKAIIPTQHFSAFWTLSVACIDDLIVADETIHTNILDISEPIIRFFERGAYFANDHDMIDIYGGTEQAGVSKYWRIPLEQLNNNPLMDLNDEALDALDKRNEK